MLLTPQGNPTCVEGGMVIQLSHSMRSVYVNPMEKTAVVDGGCLAADVDAETALHGLAAVLGVCPSVGIGGLALNGGLSLLSRCCGAACDNILAAQMVLADGSVVDVTPESDPELFWALRGAGTALGIVTKLKLRLHDVSAPYCGTLVWVDDAEHNNYRAILRWIRDVVLPSDRIGCNIMRAIDPQAGPMLVSMVVVTGDQSREEKEALLKPLRELCPVQDTVGKASWLQLQSTHAPAIAALTAAFPVHYEAWCGGHVEREQFDDALFEQWLRHSCDELPLPYCAISLCFLELGGGQLSKTSGPLGFCAEVQWVAQVGWSDAACHGSGKRFAAALKSAMQPFTSASSAYINMMDMAEVKSLAYEQAACLVGGADRLERLRAVKERVDPGNLFCHTPLARVLAAAATAPGL